MTVTDLNLGNCSLHARIPATFKCPKCKRVYCQDCVGREEEGHTICSQCVAVEAALRKKDELEAGKPEEKKSGIGLLHVFTTVAVIAICFNLYVLYQNHTQTRSAEVVRTPAMSPQLAGIRECRDRLMILSEAVVDYEKAFGKRPANLADLGSLLDSQDDLQDPVSGLPYEIVDLAGEGVMIQCPSPSSHAVHAIHVKPGKAAIVEYAGQGNRP